MCSLIVLGGMPRAGGQVTDDESLTARYFDQLRQRGLFHLAENHAESRLADPLLTPARRLDFVIELSRTLVAHALSASDDEQSELWRRAASVLSEELTVAGDSPRRILLEAYAALTPAARAEQLVYDIEASPFEDPPREALKQTATDALRAMTELDRALTEKIRSLDGRKKPVSGLTAHELRRLLSQMRLKTAFVLQAKARLSPAGSQERHSDVLDADEHFRKLLSAAGEEWHAPAKFGIAVGNRLRDDFDRAQAMLETLEREQKPSGGALSDAIPLERARVLLLISQPDSAAEILLRMRVGRERLPGEYWLVHVQTLSALRRVAARRGAKSLVAELDEQAQAALRETDDQAGGAWSRRCRAVWASAESVERYGQRLASLLNKAQGEYLAGRWESAITAYSSAIDLAHEDGQRDVELNAGYTLAAILTKAGRWDDVTLRCRQLIAAAPAHPKSPEIHLLGVYALGRLYDEEPTAERQASYLKGLTEHIQRFPQSTTVSEVDYLRGRLLETGGQVLEAVAAYERVKPAHSRFASAASAVARCWVARLLHQRETGRRDAMQEQQSLEAIAPRLKSLPEDGAGWSAENAELAYHAVKVLLLIEPARFAEAERWLDRLDHALRAATDDAEHSGIRAELGRRSGPLRLIVLAGLGRPQAAEKLLGTLEQAGPGELLAIVEELSQMEIQEPPAAKRSLVETQLASAETLNRRREELSAEQRRRLDLVLAKSYFATSQPTKAVAVYQRLLDDSPQDIALARQLGQLLSPREELNSRTLARACWQRVERSRKQGSAEWLEARCRVIEACLRLGDQDQARKLLKVTKLLYPKLGGDELLRQYAELEAQLK